MLKKWPLLFLTTLPLLTSCVIYHPGGTRDLPPQPDYGYERTETAELGDSRELLQSVLWVQTSAEYAVLARSVFARAGETLDTALNDPKWTAALEQREAVSLPKKTAVIIDIDQTILDNSFYLAQLILDGKKEDEADWKQWVLQARAGVVPGALEFVRRAESLGVTVFYITNRDAERNGDHESPLERATRKNLEDCGFTLPRDVDTVLLRNEEKGWGSDKTTRRAVVAGSYRILLLVGDDLGDFLPGARTMVIDRQARAKAHETFWTRAWFMLPNPMDGSWEGALSDYDRSLTPGRALEKKIRHLRGYK